MGRSVYCFPHSNAGCELSVQNNNYVVCKADAIVLAVNNEEPVFTIPTLKPATGKAFNPKRKNTILFCKKPIPLESMPHAASGGFVNA